jgi:putative transposase
MPEGRALLEQASEADLALALFRKRVIHPEDYQDDEQAQTAARRAAVPARTMGHLDHTELNLVLCDSRTGEPLGKCWLTLLILSHPRRIASYYITFDPPSYRSCLMVLRLCVQRYGRLPTAITVDGGPEFASVYFEQLLALYRVRKHQRPAAEPRFGAPQERLFGSMQSEFLYHLLGNTQATQQPRQMTKATDPRRHAVWTLPALAERVQQWADEEYETIRHPALGMTPRRAYTFPWNVTGNAHIERLFTTMLSAWQPYRQRVKARRKLFPASGRG